MIKIELTSEKKILLNLINIAFENHDFVLEPNNIALLKYHRNVLFVKLIKRSRNLLQSF
jgi:hypothetical protein